MRVIFSQYFDQGYYLDRSNPENEALFDISICGPKGLLSILERELGLSGSFSSQAERILGYRGILEEYLKDDNDAFFAKSFNTDPVGVAGELLRWKDQLVLAGWSGAVKGISPRLDTLAEIENSTKLSFGVEDRWIQIILSLRNLQTPLPALTAIEVEDKKAWLHPFFIELFSALEKNGIEVSYREPRESEQDDSNISLLKELAVKPIQSKEDHGVIEKVRLNPEENKSFQVLEFRNEMQAAEFLCTQEGLCKRAVIIADSKPGLSLIQKAFRISSSGSRTGSMRPQLLQILYLGTSLMLKPLNILNLISYLQIPVHPLPIGLRSKLLKLIGDSGGVPPEKWNEILAGFDFADPAAKKRAMVFAEISQYESSSIPVSLLRDFYNGLSEWARRIIMGNLEQVPLQLQELAKLRSSCKLLVSNLKELNAEEINLQELEVLINQLNEPIQATLSKEQRNSTPVISHPGQLISVPDTLIWLDFYGHDVKPVYYDFLNDYEFSGLIGKKVSLWEKEKQTAVSFEVFKKGLELTGKRLVLIRVDLEKDELTREHPLHSWLRASLSGLEELTFRPLMDWSATEYISKGLEVPDYIELQAVGLPQKRYYHNISNGNMIKLRKQESYSSLSKLVDSPFDWAFEYGAGIWPGKVLNPENTSTQFGNVAHGFIEELLKLSDKDIGNARIIVEDRYNELLDEMTASYGAVLLLEQYRFDYMNFSQKLFDSVNALLDLIEGEALRVVGMEVDTRGELEFLDGLGFSGFIDLLLENEQGEKVILDLKYSRSDERFRSMISDGRAIQLALYKALQVSKGEIVAKLGFFSLAEGRVISSYLFDTEDAINVGDAPQEEEVLESLERSVKFRLNEFSNGILEQGEGMRADELAYFEAQEENELIRLSVYDKKKNENPFSNVSPFKGEIK